MNLTENTYYGQAAGRAFMSVSQFKNFQKCEAAAMAELNGEYIPERGRALILGNYVDEMLLGTKESQDKFIEENRGELFKKNGEPYADVAQADETIIRVRKQPKMMEYLSGSQPVIMTGEIEGVPFKIKMDSYRPGVAIDDLKYMKSLRSPNAYIPIVQYWGYDVQGAIYQEIVRQNTGETLPFYLNVATKDSPARLAIGEVNTANLFDALERVKSRITEYQEIKTAKRPPVRCEDYDCDYCAATKQIVLPIDSDYFGYSAAQMKSIF